MTAIDAIFIVYGILTILMIIMTYAILKKSLSTVNYLFSITPVTFALVLVLNMLQYFVTIPDVIPRIPYLLAPLGVLFAGIYIFRGKEIFKSFYFIFFTIIYVIFCLFISFYVDYNPVGYSAGFLHLTITFPIIISWFLYYRLRSIIPESTRSIDALLIGLIVLIVGAVSRSYYFFTTNAGTDYLPGLALMMLGAIIVILSFTFFSESESTPPAKQPF